MYYSVADLYVMIGVVIDRFLGKKELKDCKEVT